MFTLVVYIIIISGLEKQNHEVIAICSSGKNNPIKYSCNIDI